jgi:hypothetical protein
MVTTSNQITQNTNKKLSIQVSLNGLSFCCQNLMDGTIESFDKISFQNLPKNQSIENHLWHTFLKFDALTKSYDEIKVIHQNNLATFVPDAFFDNKSLGRYLQYHVKVFETDFFNHDSLPNISAQNVYVPFVNINNYLIDQLGTFDYFHHHTILLQALLEISPTNATLKMYVHMEESHFEIIVLKGTELHFFNSFEYQTPIDVLYYILFTAEQLQLNPEQFSLLFLGKIDSKNPIFELTFEYVRHTEILDLNKKASAVGVSEQDFLNHFVLFNL